MTPQITSEEADQALAVLGPAFDRIATAMFGLDNHPGLSYLRSSGLSGTTAQVSEQVQALMTQLWAQFSALGQQLEQARGTRDLAVLTRLLRERVVALGDDGLPLDGPGPASAKSVASAPAPPFALAPDRASQRLTLAELAQSLEAAITELADLLTEVDNAVSTIVGRLAALTDALGEVRAYPIEDGAVEVDRLAAALDELRDLGLADPVEVARSGDRAIADRLSRLAADLASAKARLAELAQLRAGYPQRIAQLRDAIAQVAAAEAAASQSYAVVRVKIANPGLPEVPATADALQAQLSTLDQLQQADRWGRLADEVAALATATTEARGYADRLREAADGLLDRRTELRGRLSAYRAKAARHGYGEQPQLSDRHREAHDLLYTSPCDLPAATRAVFRYQQSLADLIGGSPEPKETVT
jgi:hypothetical protein